MRGALLAPALLVAAVLLPAQEIDGDWHGSIEVENDAPLRLALHIANGDAATVDSADEGIMALPVDTIAIRNNTVKFEIHSLGGVYQGTLTADASRITGSWNQDGGVWPLVWERGDDPANVTEPISATQARQRGETCARWFYQGHVAELWRNSSPVLRQVFEGEGKLADFREQAIRRFGAAKENSSGTVRLQGALQVYSRVTDHGESGTRVALNCGFDPHGSIALLSIDPAK
ncbi:MAG: hypothetical protein U0Q18_01000 [Bryobacteraceae bacterium]